MATTRCRGRGRYVIGCPCYFCVKSAALFAQNGMFPPDAFWNGSTEPNMEAAGIEPARASLPNFDISRENA